MTRKIISWLPLWAVFLFTLSSCVHDEVYSAADPESGEYTNKSLWKEDEKYIKNVKQIFDEYADHQYFSSSFGTVYWDYATTMGTYDESFLEVPVVRNSKVSFILVAYREGNRVFFKRKEEDRSKEFFQVLLFKDRRQLSGKILEGAPQSKGVVCYTQEITWTWTNDDGSEGPTYTFTETRCEHSGPYLPCQAVDVNQTCGGSGGGYGGSSGGGGGNNGYPYPPIQTPPNPCEKTKSVLNKPNVKAGINNVEAQALTTLSNVYAGEIGFKEKKDGTIAPSDVNAAHKVIFNDVTDGYGGYHNHTANGAHMFSPPDIADTLLGFAAAQDNVGDAYFGMIAAEWCATCPNNKKILHYVIQYTGEVTDLGNGGSYNFTQTQINQFISDYLLIIKDLTNKSLNGTTYIKNSAGDLNEKGLEKLFFETLIVMGMNGKVNLQRIESNGTIYNVTLDSNNMPVGTPCP